MNLNFPKYNSNGLTLVELIVGFSILLVLTVSVMVLLDPVEYRQRARDERRLSDMQTLDRVINEYNLDMGGYPDALDITRVSTALPTGQSGPLESASTGWIVADLSGYVSKLPVDPTNDANYYYSYRHTIAGYEINAILEHYTEYSLEDGGDDNAIYELGNDLSIL